ncbi:MAG: response regulator [Candidatus Woesearchaeota archaeon]
MQNGKYVVLVVDDYPDTCRILNKWLSRAGYTTLKASDGQEAIDICRADITNTIDVVLMDISMPIIGGIEALQRIKAFRNELPIIAQTVQCMHGDKERFLALGFDDYIGKPSDDNTVSQKIARYTSLKD